MADTRAALDQAALLLGAGCLAGGAALLAGNRLYWRLRARSVAGTVVGVRAHGRLYHAVYRYQSRTGKRAEATADVGAGASPRLATGRKVRLLAVRKYPDRVAEAGFHVLEGVGAALFLAAVVAVAAAVTAWAVTPLTWILLAAVLMSIAYGLQRSMPALGERPFTSIVRKSPPDGLLDTPVRPLEEILSGPVRAERQRKQRIAGLIVTPILVLAGLAVLGLGARLARTTFLLESSGERARGTVLFCELQRTLHGSSYYPVVQFTTPQGMAVQFRDSMGSDPPAYREGEPVQVLYFAAAPAQSATIDRGLLNWVGPAGLCVGGVCLSVMTLLARLSAPRAELPKANRAF